MDKFTVLEQLKKGAYSMVYLCKRNHNGQKVVIKSSVLTSEKSKVTSKNEVQILKCLKHPNVVQYFDSFIKDEVYYIIMEYATKGSLYELINSEKPKSFEPQLVVNFFYQLVQALFYIHGKKIIHRDLKTENIFLTGMKGDIIKIGDFGISRNLPRNVMASTPIGTANYVAPEICEGKQYNNKSDIWSLGCILYELCAMERLFTGPVTHIVHSIMHGTKKTIDTRRYGVQLQNLIDQMLMLDPDQRPDALTLLTNKDIAPSGLLLGLNLGCVFTEDFDN